MVRNYLIYEAFSAFKKRVIILKDRNYVELRSIHTRRSMLVPVTLERTKSLLEKSNREIKRFGINADDKWPTNDTMDILPIIEASLEKSKNPNGFELWMIVKQEDMSVIGDIGFHGKPDEKGEVEIGLGLVEHERNKGYGYEALRAIMDWLYCQESVKAIKAECLLNNKPSARILERAGMKETHRNQNLIYWKLIKHNSNNPYK